jgi:hypothetical protein
LLPSSSSSSSRLSLLLLSPPLFLPQDISKSSSHASILSDAGCETDIHPDVVFKVWGSYVPPLGSYLTYENICKIFSQLVSEDRQSKSDALKNMNSTVLEGVLDTGSPAMSTSYRGDLPRNILPNPKNPSLAPLPSNKNGKKSNCDYFDINDEMKKLRTIYEGDRFLGQKVRTLCRVIADEVAYSIWNVQSTDPSGNVCPIILPFSPKKMLNILIPHSLTFPLLLIH